ncbi:hypothetical protein L6164_001231 [Bauhinia variegata]|uniref:Uncharacterized protein n=1 Tax=Bauhinia variegata TaxID=167791 RepID=A0ACB9QBM7_BAUVA|nr:hypothetical protein L6164_001231 [Bauhinia variegata]
MTVSFPSTVHECFTKNDIVFANHPRLTIGKYISYNYTTLAFERDVTLGSCPYGYLWRHLRHIANLEFFSTHCLSFVSYIRREKVKILIKKLAWDTSKEFVKKAREFREMTTEVFSIGGANNYSDFLPILRWFDLGGNEKKFQRISKRMDASLQRLVDEHRQAMGSKNSVFDHLLTLQESQPHFYTDEIIKGPVSIMLRAGTYTSSVTIEWAMSKGKDSTMPKVIPFEAMCKARSVINKMLFEKCML